VRSAQSARSYEGVEQPAKPTAAMRSRPRLSSTRRNYPGDGATSMSPPGLLFVRDYEPEVRPMSDHSLNASMNNDERAATRDSATKRVLIVDDEPVVLAVLRDCFAAFRHGHAYEVTTAASATEAFHILRRERFDLILLDIVIPAASHVWLTGRNLGLGLLNRLRDLGVTAPVVVMTAGMTDVKPADALRAGAIGWLNKPLDVRELDEAVARALGSSGVTA
jgi:CheY-like chemotaxis protein